MRTSRLWVLVALCLSVNLARAEDVQFNRDIRPILSENCFTCHGPDSGKRKARLRLDQKAGAFADRGGYFVISPGKPDESALYRRVASTNSSEVMPPAKTGKTLTPAQVATLRSWIEQGAQWQEHWAFVPPKTPPIPVTTDKNWGRNALDSFILARLEKEGFQPSPEASKETLIRRLCLDLTGLPPTAQEVEAYLADASPDATDRLVDRLLRSPHYGEHMARFWLDGARYGDTHGLHLDNEREIWPYRDWVVKAFNENKPFNEFTIEQLAGDLLPEPTRDQLVATGFIRCNVSTSEGGAIPEEFAARYASDRTEAMATVWMGLTVGCAACHDHKYDPISQKEFYQLVAFSNNLDENPMDGNALLPPPVVKLASPKQEEQWARGEQDIDVVQRLVRGGLNALDYKDPLTTNAVAQLAPKEFVWMDDDLPEGAQASTNENAWTFITADKRPVYSGTRAHTQSAEKTVQHFFSDAKAPLRVGKGDHLFASVYLDPRNPPKAIMLQFFTDNWDHRAYWGEDLIDMGTKDTAGRKGQGSLPEAGRWMRIEVDAAQIGLTPGAKITGMAFTQHGGTVYWDKAGIVSKYPQADEDFLSLALWEAWQKEMENPNAPESIRGAIKEDPAKRSADQQKQIRDYFLEFVCGSTRPAFDPLHERLAKLRRINEDLDASIPRSMIAKELKEPRATYLLKRGDYDKKGDQVFPDVPAVLPRLPRDAPANRLTLARWLVDDGHPLTARVVVNRFWQYHFGVGLVKTAENFGSQGDPPSHPELLDWLAREFIASGWDVKHLQRLIVTSSTYRQASRIRTELAEKDPENRLLAHGPRFRMDAETVRDTVLSISGLLVDKMGGHGVKPYQPEGIWEAVAYPTSTTAKFKADEGEALYRRSLYTFWKRTAPPPSMTIFDAPSREACRVRRERTVTPMQSLALLNDVQYVEAARRLAGRMLAEGGKTMDQQLSYGFRLATARLPDAAEAEMLRTLYQDQLKNYQEKPEDAKKLAGTCQAHLKNTIPTPELAAWTMVANTILNLSETITIN